MDLTPHSPSLTLGEFIHGVYETCAEHHAVVIVWLSVNSGLLVFRHRIDLG